MVVFSNCKINIGLHILGKALNGYHYLETIMYPLPFYDCIEIIPHQTETTLKVLNQSITNNIADNLIIKAFELLKKDYNLPPTAFYLIKNIPMGAGLGGGSANAVSTLKGLNMVYKLNLTKEKLIKYAQKLGSDCAFFVANKPAIANHFGENTAPICLDLSFYKIILILPNIEISTKEAYQNVGIKTDRSSLALMITKSMVEWKNTIENDFEKIMLLKYPELGKIKKLLYDNEAIYASMSGSGSSMFGIFEKQKKINFLDHYQYLTF